MKNLPDRIQVLVPLWRHIVTYAIFRIIIIIYFPPRNGIDFQHSLREYLHGQEFEPPVFLDQTIVVEVFILPWIKMLKTSAQGMDVAKYSGTTAYQGSYPDALGCRSPYFFKFQENNLNS